METPQLIGGFKEKFESFVKLFKNLKSENADLKEKNTNLALQLEDKNREIVKIKKQLETNKLAETFIAGSSSGQDAKHKISRIVREIDNCIALLNR
ncbi:MAG: hypothetical protein JEZ09_00030 [Salinivirgaceae bacterium]|nr:hypothetical protein [Salinivirgaceae bacterium]